MKSWLSRVIKTIGIGTTAASKRQQSRVSGRFQVEFLEPRYAPAGLPSLLKDVYADNTAGNSDSRAYTQINSVVLFAGRTRQANQVLGVELWSTQGTPASTVLLKDINPGSPDGLDLPTVKFVKLGNRVFFAANNGTQGYELWQSDGTVTGTVIVKDINPGANGSFPNNLVVVGNKIFFWANNGASGNELWATDGTALGTQLVKDINPGVNGSDPSNVTVIGNKIYFGAATQLAAIEPWVSDGTTNGTILLGDINPGGNSSNPAEFTEVNGVVVFSAFQPTTGREIWKTTGTLASTGILKDIVPGTESSSPEQFTKVGTSVYFVANDDIWVTNGTTVGTVLITSTPLAPDYLYNYNGQLIFESDVIGDPSSLRLWRVSGNVASVFAVIPRNPALAVTQFFGWFNLGPKLIFFNDDGIHGFEPWVTDLTQAGTFNVKDILPGTLAGVRFSDLTAGNYAVVGPIAYFVASDNSNNYELWRTNGTSAGTLQVKDVNPGNFSSNPNSFAVIGATLYLTMTVSVPIGSPSAVGAEPFVMDVSNAGGAFPKTDIVGRQSSTGKWFVVASDGATFTTTQVGLWTAAAGVTWVDVLSGDFNGDGLGDICGRWAETGQWWVALSDGTQFNNSLFSVWSAGANVTWADVRVGDYNGDGKADIAGRYLQTGQWWVGLSNGTQFLTSLWTVWSVGAGVNWVDVRAADFNKDGKTDLAGRWNETGQWWVGTANFAGSQFDMSYWGAWSAGANVTWVDVFVGDLNADGRADLIGRYSQAGQWYAGISTGLTFAMQFFGSWSTAVTWVDVRSGDFNNDGRMDIVGRNNATAQLSVGLSSGGALTTSVWGSWASGVTWLDVRVGDFDGDGFSDVAARSPTTGVWQVSRSNGTSAFTTSNWSAVWSTAFTWVDVRTLEFNGI